jgi:transcriptional regulator with XRE-family HTH domain
MGEDPGQGRPPIGGGEQYVEEARDPEEIRATIKETREELGETVAELAEKTNLKRQARRRGATARERAVSLGETVRANPLPAIAAAAAALLIVLAVRRR